MKELIFIPYYVIIIAFVYQWNLILRKNNVLVHRYFINSRNLAFARLFCFIVFTLTIDITNASTNDFTFRKINSEKGLPTNSVICVFQDNNGFIWVGTKNGLSKYDAYTFETWKHSPFKESGLSHNIVNCLEQDKEGNMLIGTNNGLTIFNYQKNDFSYQLKIPHTSTKKKIKITSVEKTTSGKVFIGTSEGLFFYMNKRCTPLNTASNQIGFVRIIEELPDDNKIWIASNSGLYIYDFLEKTYDKIFFEEFDPSKVQYLQYDPLRNNMYIGSLQKGNFSFNLTNKQITRFRYQDKQRDTYGRVFNISMDTSNNIWISMGHSLLLYQSPDQTPKMFVNDPNNPFSRSKGIINYIFCDKDNLIWLANGKTGIDILDRTKINFPSFFKETGTDINDKNFITSFCMDNSGNLWTGSFGNGLKVFDKERRKISTPALVAKSLPSLTITSLLFDHNQEILWIGTLEGLTGINLKNGQVEKTINRKNGLSHNIILDLFIDSQNTLWIASQAGLSRYDSRKDTIINFTQDQGLCHHQISGIVEDEMKNIWISTFQGVSKYSLTNESFTNYFQSKHPEDGLSDNHTTCIDIDQNGIVWIGTNNGLTRYNPSNKRFKWFLEKDGLVDNIITNIQIDENNKLYISGNKDLTVYDQTNNSFTSFLSSEGLTINNKMFLDGDTLYLGGEFDGFYSIPSDKLKHPPLNFDVIITKISTTTRNVLSLKDTDYIAIKHEEKFVKFNYTALNYRSPQKTTFQYKLFGFDEEWVTTNHNIRQVTYNNLRPGIYEFNVRVFTNNKREIKSDSLTIEILPPIWLTLPAKIIYFIFILLIIIGYRKFITHKNSIKQKISFERKKAQLQHEKDLSVQNIFANISHEFRNPLTLISSPIEEMLNDPTLSSEQFENLQIASKNISKLNSLVDMVLDYNRLGNTQTNLKPRNIELIGYMKQLFKMYSTPMKIKNITHSFESGIEELYCSIDTAILEKTTHNLLSNALKYTPKSGTINMMIKFDDSNQKISIMICNSGKGIPENELSMIFERYVQTSDYSKHANGSGLGLFLVKEYVKLLKGEITVDSIINKETRFIINLPFSAPIDYGRVTSNEFEASKSQVYTNSLPLPSLTLSKNIETNVIHDDKIIVIVDDEPEIRLIIRKLLQSKYSVWEASDGEEGLELILNKIPDLVISDIMMPNMNGIALCNKIKTHELTSHIPVIMLTAKKALKSEIKSYETGADIYVTKPFSNSMLSIIIDNLIENREKVKSMFSKDNYANITQLYENRTDKFFLEKINQTIEENLTSAKFNVHNLAEILNMSIAQLHRKFIGLIGTSPGEYIRRFRLNTANKLLKETNMTIAEIAFQVGYKYQSHFSKSFQKQFGELPSESRNKI